MEMKTPRLAVLPVIEVLGMTAASHCWMGGSDCKLMARNRVGAGCLGLGERLLGHLLLLLLGRQQRCV